MKFQLLSLATVLFSAAAVFAQDGEVPEGTATDQIEAPGEFEEAPVPDTSNNTGFFIQFSNSTIANMSLPCQFDDSAPDTDRSLLVMDEKKPTEWLHVSMLQQNDSTFYGGRCVTPSQLLESENATLEARFFVHPSVNETNAVFTISLEEDSETPDASHTLELAHLNEEQFDNNETVAAVGIPEFPVKFPMSDLFGKWTIARIFKSGNECTVSLSDEDDNTLASNVRECTFNQDALYRVVIASRAADRPFVNDFSTITVSYVQWSQDAEEVDQLEATAE
jgi:hypothetical protein